MTDSAIDLGNLLNYILKNKDVKASLHIGPECFVESGDLKPLVKIINYLLNYLREITTDAIDVSLKTQSEGCLLCFIASTDEKKLPPLSKNLKDALIPYNAAIKVVFEEGKYAQLLICFYQGHIPDSVVIEV